MMQRLINVQAYNGTTVHRNGRAGRTLCGRKMIAPKNANDLRITCRACLTAIILTGDLGAGDLSRDRV